MNENEHSRLHSTETSYISLLYPEKRTVKVVEVLMWAHDARMNGETEEYATDLESAIRILEDLGHITVKRGM